MPSEKVHLTKEEETALGTLYFRALDSRSKQPILPDKAAEEAVSRIDYDFRKVKLPKSSALGLLLPRDAQRDDQSKLTVQREKRLLRKRQERGREKSSGVLPYSTHPGSIRE